jgi:O-antigen/teichoic acid export membrane protein
MKDFFKAFLSFGLATSIQKLLGFVILPIYTRYFNKTEYGVIDMIGSVFAVVAILGLLQLETSLQRFFYEYKGLKRKLLVSNIYIWVAACSVSIGLLIFFSASFISTKLFNTVQYSLLIKTISIQVPLANVNMLGLVLLRFEKKNVQFLIVIITQVVFSLLFVYLFIINLQLGLPGVFYAQVASMILSTALVTFYVRHLLLFRLSKILSYKNLKYALPQFPARVGSMILDQANRFFMLGFLTLGAIGIFSVSMKLASVIQLVNTAFILAWAPFMHAQFKNKNNKVVFSNVFPIVVSATFCCVCLISLFSKEMVRLLATKEFYEAYKYVGGLTLFFSLYIIKETIDIGPKIREKTKYLSYTFLLSVVVNVISLYIFIQLFQLSGVVFSMIITNLFLVSISWFVSNRLYYIPFNIRIFIILLIPALSIATYTMYTEIPLIYRIIIALSCLAFYGSLLPGFYKRLRSFS